MRTATQVTRQNLVIRCEGAAAESCGGVLGLLPSTFARGAHDEHHFQRNFARRVRNRVEVLVGVWLFLWQRWAVLRLVAAAK